MESLDLRRVCKGSEDRKMTLAILGLFWRRLYLVGESGEMHICIIHYLDPPVWLQGKGTDPVALSTSNTKAGVRNKSITHFHSLCRRVYLAQIAEIASYVLNPTHMAVSYSRNLSFLSLLCSSISENTSSIVFA